MKPARRPGGFTLLELLIALSIVGALLAIAFGGLRVALAAWGQGEARAGVHQELRGVAVIIRRALGAAYPYRGPLGAGLEQKLLFRGEQNRIELVTQAAPLPASTPIAFTALVVGVETDEGRPALVVRQRALPNREPFTEAAPVLRDDAVEQIQFQYLTDTGSWQDTWDAEQQNGLPRAVRVTFALSHGGRTETLPPLTIALRPVFSTTP